MGHSYRFAQAEDSVSFAGFLSPDLSPLSYGHGAGETFWGGDQGNRMVPVLQYMPQAALLGQCQPCLQLCQRLQSLRR